MAGTKEARNRSESQEQDENYPSSDEGQGTSAAKPGRKKNPNSQAARRDQNRIAQREFRLRKQQRIRDLEASVEILSGGKDAALAEMREILKDLMAENHTLRGLLRSLSAFIGEGAGGVLPKLGWSLNDFEDYVNRAETDTAWESFQKHKHERQSAQPEASTSQPATNTRKRPVDDPNSNRHKRQRSMTADEEHSNEFPALGSSVPANGNTFNDLLRTNTNASPMFMTPQSAASQPAYSASGSTSSFLHGLGLESPVNGPTDPVSLSLPPPRVNQNLTTVAESPEENETFDPKVEEAGKLIAYHLDNYKRVNTYCLPASLRPTLLQRTMPHESIIDAVLHPEIRDRMIMFRGRYDLVDCLHDYRLSVKVHGDEILNHANWEISEKWLRGYNLLVDTQTIEVVNRWRRERGDPELRVAEFAKSTEHPS
ncbi:hypothetical protein BDM02DRAFT_3142281 [Thelephora ganbajun]|uniref:Uncharacterized protein n=1 Tax=Thelephora ganbajun TaxID=370292 RepID=A0ACB6ZJN6_THEGA|nr:hypothetical protein BDM02DRAFT_3142281 [Thelephora ganbajun]